MKNGVKPSAQRPNLTFRGSAAIFGYFWSKCFQANPSDDAGEYSILGGAHDAISYGLQSFLRHIVVAILGLKEGSAFLHMKHPYDLVGWISLVIVLHVHKICMWTNPHLVYNKACNYSDNNQFLEHPYLNLSLFWAADDNFLECHFQKGTYLSSGQQLHWNNVGTK